MFMRRCDNEQPHSAHEYGVHWLKTDLPLLPTDVAIRLPAEWDVNYRCKGVEYVFCNMCAGPYDHLLAQYGGHWDTCPNRATAILPEDTP